MKIRGIIYDVGLEYRKGQKLREINEEKLKEEFRIIRDELNCNAIGLHGSFNEKLLKAAKIGLEEGLEVWFFPRYINRSAEETFKLFEELAKKAEKLRKKYEKVVLGIGDELSVNCSSFFSGKNYVDRVRRLRCYVEFSKLFLTIQGNSTPDWFLKFKDKKEELHFALGEFGDKEKIEEMQNIANVIESYLKNFQENFLNFLSELVKIARKNFNGKISYSSGWWEPVDWSIFDLIGIGIYLGSENWFTYKKILSQLKEKFKKPVIVTEFGASTFKYASMYGGGAWSIFEKFEVERSEEEQAEHIRRQFEKIKKADVDGCFLFVFVDAPDKIFVQNPKNYKEDGDRGGYGIMKILPDGRLEPKKAFYTLKELYSTWK
jgi:hypothetical protein